MFCTPLLSPVPHVCSLTLSFACVCVCVRVCVRPSSLDIFFQHRHQCAFDVHVGRFKASLFHPTARKPHPSLVDAVYLLACYFSRAPAYTELEPHFLKRSLRGIADALQHSDRIVHVLQASCLLAVYFFWHGRTLEGYYHSSIAARLAVGLGLHQIRHRDWFHHRAAAAAAAASPYPQEAPAPLKASVPLSPPVDEVEYAERIAAFWQIFSVDRAWAVATGLPTALPDDDHPRSRIETIWPFPIPDDPEVRVLRFCASAVSRLSAPFRFPRPLPRRGDLQSQPTLEDALLQPFPDCHLSGSSDNAALRVRAIALYERTARFSSCTSPLLSLHNSHPRAQLN